ncbi:hypothetical protein FQN49_004884 [Arthroderma sp. PD_2]|nr:hypothetical protein FQN49_004884 [Arthroderma sp. PD_2]
MASENAGDATDKGTTATVGSPQFVSKATQTKQQDGDGDDSLSKKTDSLIESEGSPSSVAIKVPEDRSETLTSAKPESPKLESADSVSATVDETTTAPAPAPGTTPDTAPASDPAGNASDKETKRKFRRWKDWKARKNEENKDNKPVEKTTGELKDTTNRNRQKRKMTGARNKMKRRNEEDGAAPTDTPESSKVAEGNKSDIKTSEGKEDSLKGEDYKTATPENLKEDAAPPLPLDKWAPIFPPGCPRPIREPVDDETSNGLPRRTNYIDEKGNYHAPNGTVMSPELLAMFASGKIRNSFGDRVIFMPSFLEDIPAKGQKPVVLPPTPYYIFYDPKDLEKAE